MKTWEATLPNPTAAVQADEWPKMQELVKDMHILEIGSFVGYSAYRMAQTAARVDCVEDFEWHLDLDARERHPRNTYRQIYTVQDFFQNNFDLIHEGKIGLHIGKSVDIVPRFAPNFDGCFIDGNHTPEDVFTDLMLCNLVVKQGGLFMLHDFNFQKVIDGFERWRNEFLRKWSLDKLAYITIEVPVQTLEGTSLAWFYKTWNW